MTSEAWFFLLVGVVAVERMLELVVSDRNMRWSRERGGQESGFGHYPPMVVLHTALLAGCVIEVLVSHPDFIPGLGWPMLLLVVASQVLRWWCIATLGRHWNSRIVVIPGFTPVTAGPYRWLRHPNYVAVVVEGFALPLVHTAVVTAVAFTVLNAALLNIRIRSEDAAMRSAHA